MGNERNGFAWLGSGCTTLFVFRVALRKLSTVSLTFSVLIYKAKKHREFSVFF